MGVRTRKSLPDASEEEVTNLLDAKEARRLQTNAKFDGISSESRGPSLGVYHWRGAVYAIEPHTPREWILRGEAEWAETQKKRERRKSEKEEGIRRRREEGERERKRKREESGKREESEKREKREKKKQKKSGEVEMMDKMTLYGEEVVRKRKREERGEVEMIDSGSSTSTASSNIDVRPRPRLSKSQSLDKYKDVDKYKKMDMDTELSEDDSTDLPTLADIHASNISADPLPLPLLDPKARAIQDLTADLWSLAKINDRLDILRRWYDRQNTAGAYQRIVVIAKKIRDEKHGVMNMRERAELRRFSDSVGSDNVELLLNQAVEEEEVEEEKRAERAKGRAVMAKEEEEEEEEDVIMFQEEVEEEEEAPIPPTTPDSERVTSQQQHPSTTIVTPPASDTPNSPVHGNNDDGNNPRPHQPTPPPSSTSSSSAQLPSYSTVDSSGNTQRWSFDPAQLNNIKLKYEEMNDPKRAEHAICMRRLDGETKTQKRRRVLRELKVLGLRRDNVAGKNVKRGDGWTIIRDPNHGDGEEEELKAGMEGIVYDEDNNEDGEDKEGAMGKVQAEGTNKGKERARF